MTVYECVTVNPDCISAMHSGQLSLAIPRPGLYAQECMQREMPAI